MYTTRVTSVFLTEKNRFAITTLDGKKYEWIDEKNRSNHALFRLYDAVTVISDRNLPSNEVQIKGVYGQMAFFRNVTPLIPEHVKKVAIPATVLGAALVLIAYLFE